MHLALKGSQVFGILMGIPERERERERDNSYSVITA